MGLEEEERGQEFAERGGPHDASHGGTGISPGDVLSILCQPSQESVPAKAKALPTKARIAAQV